MDFQKIISELVERKLKQADIAEKCDCAQSTISELLNGKIKSPNYRTGKALIELHSEVISGKKKRTPGRRSSDYQIGRRQLTDEDLK